MRKHGNNLPTIYADDLSILWTFTEMNTILEIIRETANIGLQFNPNKCSSIAFYNGIIERNGVRIGEQTISVYWGVTSNGF